MPTVKSRVDELIEDLFDALPADGYEEIADKMSKGRRTTVTPDDVNEALTTLRSMAHKDPDRYGWTVPHVKRGKVSKRDKGGRFFAVLLTKGGALDYGPDERAHLNRGFAATVGLVASQSKNEVAALRAAYLHETSPTRKRMLRDLADDFEYVSRKARTLLAEIKAA